MDVSLSGDGRPIEAGPLYYCAARLHDPAEPVVVLDCVGLGRSVLDGRETPRLRVRTGRGAEFLVEPWQLSRTPPGELVRALLAPRVSAPAPPAPA